MEKSREKRNCHNPRKYILGTYKKAHKLFFIKNVLGKLHEIANINPNEKYGNRPNLPCENDKRTVLVPISTLRGNAHYITFINLIPTVFSDKLQRFPHACVCYCLQLSVSEYGIGKEFLGTTDHLCWLKEIRNHLRLKCGTFE